MYEFLALTSFIFKVLWSSVLCRCEAMKWAESVYVRTVMPLHDFNVYRKFIT